MASAVTAANATIAAPTHTAGTRPATYAEGETYDPFAEKTGAKTATPNTPPTSRIALLAPEVSCQERTRGDACEALFTIEWVWHATTNAESTGCLIGPACMRGACPNPFTIE